MTYQGNLLLRLIFMILPLGFIAHIAGMLFITDGSRHTTISNATFFIPALILCFFDRPLRKSLISRKYLYVGLMLAFTVIIAMTNSNSENSASLQLKKSLYVILYLASISLLIRKGIMEACLNSLFVLSGITAVSSIIVQAAVQDSNIFLSDFRLYSLGYKDFADFKNPVVAALYYGFFGVYGFAQLLTKPHPRSKNLLFSACIIGLSLYVYCTFARGVWLGYGLALCVTAVLHHSHRTKKWLIVAAVITLAVAIGLRPVLEDQYSRGLSLRDVIWKEWLERIEEFGIVGAGAGQRFEICLTSDQCFSQAHNLFLQFFYEYGVIGIALMVAMLLSTFCQSLDRRHWRIPLAQTGLPLLIFCIVTAMFNYHTVLNRPGVYWMIFWLPIGIILSTQARTSHQEKITPPIIDTLNSVKRYWHIEIIGSLDKPFKWKRILQKYKRNNRYRYIFWFRLAYVLHAQGNKFWRRRAKMLNEKISRKYNVEIMLGAAIGEGLWIAHPTGIVITSHARIGNNFKIWQNCTIGIKGQHEDINLVIGDGVRVHAHSCIISDNLELGNNVIVGAGSFVNKSIPAGHVVFNSRTDVIRKYDANLIGRLQQ